MIFIDPKLWAVSSGKPLGDFSEGDITQLNEGGVPVDFYVAKHDYESALNGAGRTLVVRKYVYDKRQWNTSEVNAYATSDIDNWLNSSYKSYLDPRVQSAIAQTTFYYTPGNGDYTVSQVSRGIFILSMTELGYDGKGYGNVEGQNIPVCSLFKNEAQWSRSPYIMSRPTSACCVLVFGSTGYFSGKSCISSEPFRPVFTLPSDFRI